MDEAEWVEGFVHGLANPAIAGDEAYLRLIGERLYSHLWQLAPDVVVETLRQQSGANDGGALTHLWPETCNSQPRCRPYP
jgi:hypothetical protein